MGIFKYFKRRFKNSGARLSVNVYMCERTPETPADPALALSLTWNELHGRANFAKVELVRSVRKSPFRPKLPDDYWLLASLTLAGIAKQHPINIDQQPNTLATPLVCLLVDLAFKEFDDNDTAFVFFAPEKGTVVELMGMAKPKFNTHTFAAVA